MILSALGHASDAASAVYEREGNRRAAPDRAFAALESHSRRAPTRLAQANNREV